MRRVLNSNRQTVTLGIDLGGTKVEMALVDEHGHILVSRRRLTQPEQGPDGVINDIIACVHECLADTDKTVPALGIGVAGQVDTSGIVRFAPNLGWHNVPLKENLENALDMPVIINNDVRMATFGEWQHGAGQGVNDLVCIFVGTGIGGGVVSGGQLLQGCGNTAAELGHLTIVSNGRSCRCPNQGCFEAYAGGWGIAERAQEAVLAEPPAGERLITLAGDIKQISAATVTQAYHEGDPLAASLIEETAQYLAAGVVSIINAFNPCLIILGGGVIQGIPEYVPAIERAAQEKALPPAVENLRVVTAALGNKAGVIGAAALARKQLNKATET